MPDELIFYTNPQSRGRIVRWMLEEVGQPYRTELLDYDTTIPSSRRERRSAPISPTRFRRRSLRRLLAIAAAAPITGGCFSRPVRSRRPPATRRWASSCHRAANG
jgi:hypothetical protein